MGSFRALPELARTPMHGFTGIAFISHKVLRWVMPFLFIGMLGSNIPLIDTGLYGGAVFVCFYQKHEGPPKETATGVHLVPLDDIGHLATVKSILGGDPAPMLAALLPAGGVLVVNGSPKTLIAVGVAWRGPSKDQAGRTAKLIITEVLPVAPGASMIFTPGSPINHYLHGSVQIINGSKSGAPPSKAPDFASFVQESLSTSPIAQYVESYLAGVAFDDNTFVGADMVLGPLQRSHPEIHR